MVIGSPWRPMTYPAHRSWLNLQYQAWVPFHETGLRSRQNVAGYSHHDHATAVPIGTCWQGGPYSSLQISKLGKIISGFSPPVVCIAPSRLWELAGREEAFSSVPAWFLCVLYPKCVVDVFSPRSYHQILVGGQEQWWSCSVLRASGPLDLPDLNNCRGILQLALKDSFNNLWLLKEALPPQYKVPLFRV